MAPRASPSDLRKLPLDELVTRLQEAEETLDAIRLGEVDAVVVGGPSGQQVYTLENADRPYRVIIEQMQEGAITIQEDGLLLYCNDRFVSLLGAMRESLIGTSITTHLGTEATRFLTLLSAAGQKGVSGEFSLRNSSGGVIPVTISLVKLESDLGMPPMVCGVVTDLTGSRERSHELTAANTKLASQIRERQRAEAGLQLALDAAEMGYWELESATGIATTSQRHDAIFGFDHKISDWSYSRFIDQVVEEDRLIVEQAFQTQSDVVEFSCRIRRSGDQALRWLQVRGLAYAGTDTTKRMAGVVLDVTNARETEEQLRQAQKMEAVGQLTGGIAHDFNNLLAGISGSLEMMHSRLAQGRPLEIERYVDIAQRAANRAAALTQRLLAFSRRQTLSPKTTKMNSLIAGMEDLLRRSIGPSVELDVQGADGLWSTMVDPPQLENALLNLCLNARDAMPDGGKITIATANTVLNERAAKERDLTPGEYVTLSVTDTGVGMAKDVAERAFDPFFTTKPLGQGTGLGLSMIYGFAKQSGGQIRIYSEVGKGTTMRLYLPRSDASTDASVAKTDSHETMDRGQGQVILVVDDEPTIRMLVAEVLDQSGYATIEAADGVAALRVLESNAKIDLLVTDVGLPGGMNGRQVADAGIGLRPDLQTLFITGYAENAVVNGGNLSHGMRVLTKPFTMEILTRVVREMLER